MIYIGIAAAIFLLDGLIKGYIEKTEKQERLDRNAKGFYGSESIITQEHS